MNKHVSHETSRGNEVPVVARRRRHTRSEKLRILEEADRCEEYGGLSALARREGVYVSTLSRWKVWRERMQAEDTPGKVQNPQAETYESLRGQVRKMERENKRLRLRLARAEGLLELQKKAAALLDSLNRAEPSGGRC